MPDPLVARTVELRVPSPRFRDRRLEATVGYAGSEPLERHLATLAQFQLTVRRSDDGHLEISLGG